MLNMRQILCTAIRYYDSIMVFVALVFVALRSIASVRGGPASVRGVAMVILPSHRHNLNEYFHRTMPHAKNIAIAIHDATNATADQTTTNTGVATTSASSPCPIQAAHAPFFSQIASPRRCRFFSQVARPLQDRRLRLPRLAAKRTLGLRQQVSLQARLVTLCMVRGRAGKAVGQHSRRGQERFCSGAARGRSLARQLLLANHAAVRIFVLLRSREDGCHFALHKGRRILRGPRRAQTEAAALLRGCRSG